MKSCKKEGCHPNLNQRNCCSKAERLMKFIKSSLVSARLHPKVACKRMIYKFHLVYNPKGLALWVPKLHKKLIGVNKYLLKRMHTQGGKRISSNTNSKMSCSEDHLSPSLMIRASTLEPQKQIAMEKQRNTCTKPMTARRIQTLTSTLRT